MTITEEIEEVAEGMAEVPDRSKFTPNKFSSGQGQWYNTEVFSQRERFVRCAKTGCIGAKQTLRGEPFNVTELILGGRVVIPREEVYVYKKSFH